MAADPWQGFEMVSVARRVLVGLLVVMLAVTTGAGWGASPGGEAAVAAVPTSSTTEVMPSSPSADWGETGRLEGKDRYGTAVAIAQRSFPERFAPGEGVVYLARGDVFADALAGGALTDGPVLLVRSCGAVPSAVRAEIDRLAPARVVALGAAGAVCDEVLTTVAAGRATARLEGKNRYETAAAIAAHAFPDGRVAEVYLATGADLAPDAIAGGALTAGPILLVRPNGSIPSATAGQIARLDPHRVIALGGETVVSDAALKQAGAGRDLDRLAGPNRYGTSAAIAAHAFPRDVSVVYLARGDVFADAVAAGSLTDGPVLLVRGECGPIPSAVANFVTEKNPKKVYALGGPSAVCEQTLVGVGSLVTPPEDGVELAPETEILTQDELEQVEAFDPDTGTIVLGNAAPSLGSLTEGDIVIAGFTESVPTGFLRRVEDVKVTDTSYVLATSEAELPQAVADTGGAAAGGEAVLVASYVEPGDGVEIVDGLIPTAQAHTRPDFISPDAVEVKLEHTLRLKKEWEATTGKPDANFTGTGTVKVDSTVKVGGKLEADMAISWFTLDELLIKAGPTAEASLNANVTGQLKGGADVKLAEVTRIWNIQVGPVPVVLVEKTGMNLETEITTSGSIGLTTGIKAASAIGIHYKNNEINPILASHGTATPPTLHAEATATVSATIGPQTDIRAYGVAGLKGKAGPWARATATMTESDPLSCTLTAGLAGELAAVAAIDILGFKLSMEKGRELRLTLLDEELCDKDPGDPEPGELVITTPELPAAHLNQPYSAQLTATGGTPPYAWNHVGGALPAGLHLSSAGTITGTPTTEGYYEPTFTITDSTGNTATGTFPLPVIIGEAPDGTPVSSIATGWQHTCAVTTMGATKCWGINLSGQLGDGTTEHRWTPVDVVGLGPGSTASITAGASHTCAVTVDGAAKCWGHNWNASLGDGTLEQRWTPVDVVGLGVGTTASITAAVNHTCAVTVDGAAKCWGGNTHGQVGDDSAEVRWTPVDVVSLGEGTTTSITAGELYTCAVTIDGAAKCWGYNKWGKLGDGTAEDRWTPVEVVGLGPGTTASITARQSHTCAVTVDNAAKCWGYNGQGQLGDATYEDRSTPIDVVGLGPGNTASITAGSSHTCAVTVDGAAECWGYNYWGQLGDGTFSNRKTPVDVTGLGAGNTTSISVGADHTCAVDVAGAAKCWGNNDHGQVGDGSNTMRWVPVDVIGLQP